MLFLISCIQLYSQMWVNYEDNNLWHSYKLRLQEAVLKINKNRQIISFQIQDSKLRQSFPHPLESLCVPGTIQRLFRVRHVSQGLASFLKLCILTQPISTRLNYFFYKLIKNVGKSKGNRVSVFQDPGRKGFSIVQSILNIIVILKCYKTCL